MIDINIINNLISQKYYDICISYSMYGEFLSTNLGHYYNNEINIIIDSNLLKKGLFFKINDCNIWVSIYCKQNKVKIYKKYFTPLDADDSNWSTEIDCKYLSLNIDKILKNLIFC